MNGLGAVVFDADAPGCTTVHAVAARKEEISCRSLRTAGVHAFEDVLPTLRQLREKAVRCAAVSASRHARSLLEAADLVGSFDAVVDGADAFEQALPGKPDPALFLAAAARLGTAPSRAAVVEDALVGVEAGHGGGFRLVVGLNRENDPRMAEAFLEKGAHLVLPDLTELPAALEAGPAPPVNATWRWECKRYDPKAERLVGNTHPPHALPRRRRPPPGCHPHAPRPRR
ncbi:HAD family phosphatase [Streptomyces sp. WAC06614]|uniref:HAD family hydrolase n=1 Tax=Streptomyces sp. WAC06614 TaxID=2487416 RepID=UPI000F785FED|nr:HAD-IA family hydrolase [Streptomyces sp. WAC06614]RSS79717.1 HAD family hydrolase [Streptomyces sp. WAC06614]